MLRGLRKASSNWLGKAIMSVAMGALIVSFGIWGIADIFRGFGQSVLAKVGHTEISVCPTLASVDCPKPRKMSAMPQMPKLTINTPITTAMMVLPSQFDEALRNPRSMRPTCLLEGGVRLIADFAKGRHRIDNAYKVAVGPSQP